MGSSVPPLPASSATGRVPSLTTHLPMRKGGAGKIVVMLSSVAKPPPAGTQTLPPVAPISRPPKLILSPPSEGVSRPPPLPPKQVSPSNKLAPPQLSTTTHVRLPSKTNPPPRWASTSGASASAREPSVAAKEAPPPLPAKGPEPVRNEQKKSGAQHIPPIKLNELSSPADRPAESIFPEARPADPAPKPAAWKSLEPGELTRPAENQPGTSVFPDSLPGSGHAALLVPAEAKKEAVSQMTPPSFSPASAETGAPSAGGAPSVRPPPLPPSTSPTARSEAGEVASMHTAPPLLEKPSEPASEKLPPPNLPDVRKAETPPGLPEPTTIQKVPALIEPEAKSLGQKPSPSPKPLLPPTSPIAKGSSNWLKKSTPIVLSSTSRARLPKISEAKPARIAGTPVQIPLTAPFAAEAPGDVTKSEDAFVAAPLSEPKPAFSQPSEPASSLPSSPPPAEKKKSLPNVKPTLPSASVPLVPTTKRALPETRAARSKKRRFGEIVVFWAVLLPLTALALTFGTLYFCRDTRVEGQVIPPPGMTLNDEVWIVTNFSSYATGIADDLAKERTPLLQEIQEKQQHVQRAQADVAAREERIRLIQDEIQASRDEIASVVKQSRDATQKIWDGEGAQINDEYKSRFNGLQAAIAARAKTLNLKYQPDPSFPSPEVWANAYRLALYEVPAGVDGVKEHQWLSDQMTQWRAFLKTLDDRTEKLREEAAQLKLAPAPKIADLNAKIDEGQQRIDGTTAEEVPLKAEVQQAQADLAAVQATEAGLDEKYYKELDSLPEGEITKHIPLATNGRFTMVEDDPFQGEKDHHYWIFSRATRTDGRQYWALDRISIRKNSTLEVVIEPTNFISTKAILRPNLSPDEQDQ